MTVDPFANDVHAPILACKDIKSTTIRKIYFMRKMLRGMSPYMLLTSIFMIVGMNGSVLTVPNGWKDLHEEGVLQYDIRCLQSLG